MQIDEAHSEAWPMALPTQPTPQQNFQERVERANAFVTKYKCPYPVYVDGWNNIFAETFRAWPDKFYFVKNSDLKVISKSEYHKEGALEAVIIEDYTELLTRLFKV